MTSRALTSRGFQRLFQTRRGGGASHTRKKTTKTRKYTAYAPGPCQCRPRIGKHRPASGCIPQTELLRISKQWYSKGKGQGDTRKIRESIAKELGVSPDEEATFIEALPISSDEKKRLHKEYLRPKQPSAWKDDPDMWLDSNNIRDVMSQYEEDYADFKFLGPFPIDFAAPDPYEKNNDTCLVDEMCKIDIPALKSSGKTKIGIVYNLDPHYKNGSHWVANYIDLEKHCCYYFDSYGMEAPKQIQKFMQFLTLKDPQMKLAYNARRFQFQGSECGMYSMYFIIRMLMGEPFLKFCRRAPRDGIMLALRNWLFSK